MSHPLTNIEKTQKLKWALTADAFNVAYVYLAFAGPIFLLFLDKLGLDTGQIGIVMSLFSFCGLLALVTAPVSARLGFKRVFLSFWTVRKFVLVGVIAAPWVIDWYGAETGFLYVAGILLVFALCRTIAESAITPWSHEYIPATIRGRFTAIQSIVIMVTGAATVAIASRFLGPSAPLERFQWLFAAGFVAGLSSVFFYAKIPGGGPIHEETATLLPRGNIFLPLRDPQFRRFLLAATLMQFGWMSMAAFLPLFYARHVGLHADQVVMLDAVYMVGGLCSSFFWGWAADRYGGKPVMLIGLVLILLYPLGLLFLPHGSPTSNLIAMGLVATIGLAAPGWNIGYFRYLFVNLVPAEHKARYIALHTAVIGVSTGICTISAGRILEWNQHLSGQLGPIHITPFTPFFVASLAFGGCAVWTFSKLAASGGMPATRFAAMFVQGDPVGAIRALIGYNMAGHEIKRISLIERLGQTRSPFSVDELIAALDDPSFNVRYEALISIARTRPDPRLTEAVVRVLRQGDADLRTTAAWALGRMGDRSAIPQLREMLDSSYQLLRARTARALGTLGDTGAIDRILELFDGETDEPMRVAYASALASLGCSEATPRMLALLAEASDPVSRREVSLAVATLLGRDEAALRLWRRMHDEPGDTVAGVLLGLRRRLTSPAVARSDTQTLQNLTIDTSRAFGMNQHDAGAANLARLIDLIGFEAFEPVAQTVLQEAGRQLKVHGAARMEYVLLVVHALHVGMARGTEADALATRAVIGDKGRP